jgi:hypothetical protein
MQPGGGGRTAALQVHEAIPTGNDAMERKERGLLAVWMNVTPGAQADFDAWYTCEHIPERVGVPGFLNGNRYEALRGTPRFLAVYDTASPAVLTSAPYLARLDDPTPWTRRVMPNFRDTVRAVARTVAEAGRGTGGTLRTYRIEPAEGRRTALREALAGPVLDALAREPGVLRVRFCEAEDDTPRAETAETAMRGPDRSVSLMLLVDGLHPEVLATACDRTLPEERLAGLGAQPPVEVGDYRLQFSLVP